MSVGSNRKASLKVKTPLEDIQNPLKKILKLKNN